MVLRILGVCWLLMFPLSRTQADTVLWFVEQEPGVAPYKTRMIVNAHFIRMDDGQDRGDFLLFDRKLKRIYNTNSLDKTILVINNRKTRVTASPLKLVHEHKQEKLNAPPIGEFIVRRHLFYTNGQLCMEVFAADGLLPDVQQALREYRQVLAGEHLSVVVYTPVDQLRACDLANNIFTADRHLQYGFPVNQREPDGRLRELLNFKTDQKTAASLFELPKGYQHFTPQIVREAD